MKDIIPCMLLCRGWVHPWCSREQGELDTAGHGVSFQGNLDTALCFQTKLSRSGQEHIPSSLTKSWSTHRHGLSLSTVLSPKSSPQLWQYDVPDSKWWVNSQNMTQEASAGSFSQLLHQCLFWSIAFELGFNYCHHLSGKGEAVPGQRTHSRYSAFFSWVIRGKRTQLFSSI